MRTLWRRFIAWVDDEFDRTYGLRHLLVLALIPGFLLASLTGRNLTGFLVGAAWAAPVLSVLVWRGAAFVRRLETKNRRNDARRKRRDERRRQKTPASDPASES